MDAFLQQAPICCAPIESIGQDSAPNFRDASISQMALTKTLPNCLKTLYHAVTMWGILYPVGARALSMGGVPADFGHGKARAFLRT